MKHDQFASIALERELKPFCENLMGLRHYRAEMKDGRVLGLTTTKHIEDGNLLYEWAYSEDGFEAEGYSRWCWFTTEKAKALLNGEREELYIVKYQIMAKWYFENGQEELDGDAVDEVIAEYAKTYGSAKNTLMHFLKADLKEEFQKNKKEKK